MTDKTGGLKKEFDEAFINEFKSSPSDFRKALWAAKWMAEKIALHAEEYGTHVTVARIRCLSADNIRQLAKELDK